jgi:hypothetical protein
MKRPPVEAASDVRDHALVAVPVLAALVPVMAAIGRAGAVAPFVKAETARAVGIDPAMRPDADRVAGVMMPQAVMPAAKVRAILPAVMPAAVMVPPMRGSAGGAERDADEQGAQQECEAIHDRSFREWPPDGGRNPRLVTNSMAAHVVLSFDLRQKPPRLTPC